MTTPVLKRLSAACLTIGLACIVVGFLIVGVKLHWFDWAFTPQGKDEVVMLLFGVTCAGLAWVALLAYVRDRKADRRYWAESQAEIHDAWEDHPYVPVRSHAAVRRITDADKAAVAVELDAEADLDAWEAEMLDSVEAALPDSWRESFAANDPQPEPVALPEPSREVAVHVPDPHWATVAPMYNGLAGEWRSERIDGLPVVDEQTYAARVMVGFSRVVAQNSAALVLAQAFGDVVDAMPVSPAPQGRTGHRWGQARGTDTQRAQPDFTSWEQPTGAFPILVAAMAGAR